MVYVCVVGGNVVSVPLFAVPAWLAGEEGVWVLLGKVSAVSSGFLTAKFIIRVRACAAEAKFIIKVRACAAGNVVSFTDTVWLLGVVLVLLAVWLADTVPWVAGKEVALPEFADSDL